MSSVEPMGARSNPPRHGGSGPTLRAEPQEQAVHARRWRADHRCAMGCTAVFLGWMVALGWGLSGLTALHVVLWGASAAVVLCVMSPPRISAGHGWLAVRPYLRTRRVRTDALVSVSRIGHTAVTLVLRDMNGGRVEVDPRLLEADPLLWHLVDEGVRRSQARGTLTTGGQVLEVLGNRVDEQAGAILLASGMR